MLLSLLLELLLYFYNLGRKITVLLSQGEILGLKFETLATRGFKIVLNPWSELFIMVEFLVLSFDEILEILVPWCAFEKGLMFFSKDIVGVDHRIELVDDMVELVVSVQVGSFQMLAFVAASLELFHASAGQLLYGEDTPMEVQYRVIVD